MPWLACKSRRIHYELTGPEDGPACVLVNGLTQYIKLWLPQITLMTNVMMWENQRMYAAAGYEEYARSAPAPGFERIHYRKAVAAWDAGAPVYLPPAETVARTSPDRSTAPGSHRRVVYP